MVLYPLLAKWMDADHWNVSHTQLHRDAHAKESDAKAE